MPSYLPDGIADYAEHIRAASKRRRRRPLLFVLLAVAGIFGSDGLSRAVCRHAFPVPPAVADYMCEQVIHHFSIPAFAALAYRHGLSGISVIVLLIVYYGSWILFASSLIGSGLLLPILMRLRPPRFASTQSLFLEAY